MPNFPYRTQHKQEIMLSAEYIAHRNDFDSYKYVPTNVLLAVWRRQLLVRNYSWVNMIGIVI